jgi:hypothetical protein
MFPDTPTTPDQFAQQSLVNAKAFKAIMDAQAYQRYQQAVANYNASMDSGRDYPGPTPPAGAPLGMVILTDPSTGYSYPVAGTLANGASPAGPDIPLHSRVQTVAEMNAAKTPGLIDVGTAIPGGNNVWFSVGPQDAYPLNKQTPPGTHSADGVVGTFLRVGAAVGPGWYEKVG